MKILECPAVRATCGLQFIYVSCNVNFQN